MRRFIFGVREAHGFLSVGGAQTLLFAGDAVVNVKTLAVR